MPVVRASLAASALVLALAACGGSKQQERIRNVTVVGTVVDGSLYSTGRLAALVVPFDSRGQPVLDTTPRVTARVAGPAGVTATVVETTCALNPQRLPLATGIAIDDSSSMLQADPDDASGFAPGRKAAVRTIVDAMQPGDLAMLGDFSGTSGTPLRDLVCGAATPDAACVPTVASFTGDHDLLKGGVAAMRTVIGTPLYEACSQLVPLVAALPDMRHAMLVLSDGLPGAGEEAMRNACLAAARSAGMSIYTIGFGTAAEGPSNDAEAVRAMRELSEATGGGYAPSTDPARVARLLADMSFSAGSCTVVLELSGHAALATGTPVEVDLAVNGAPVRFSFLAPSPSI